MAARVGRRETRALLDSARENWSLGDGGAGGRVLPAPLTGRDPPGGRGASGPQAKRFRGASSSPAAAPRPRRLVMLVVLPRTARGRAQRG